MLGTAFGYFLRHPIRGVSALADDPLEAWMTIQDRYVDRRERAGPRCSYQAEDDWEDQLHALLGEPWPCEGGADFRALWPAVVAQLSAKGVRVGPESFGPWNDGDAGLTRAIWCLVRHLRPHNVVETGVAHGLTTRFVLEAMESNGVGHLWSIDLPPLNPTLRREVGLAVGNPPPRRWSYLKGSSRRRLPGLLAYLGQIDLFIHDSLHSERNLRFELDRAWQALRPGGALVIDDIDANWGFHSFTQAHPGLPSLICEAEPLHPDNRRFNHKGLFGIILKPVPAAKPPSDGCT
jgi:Methyltransferase domain